MSLHKFVLIISLSQFTLFAGCTNPAPRSHDFTQRRPVATYSIVARDPSSGQIGVAVQSHWFSVGSVVPWAEAGVGAVATQSLVDPSYGPLGLAAMGVGRSAPEALIGLLAGDDGREVRQVAMIDSTGVTKGTGVVCQCAAYCDDSCLGLPRGRRLDSSPSRSAIRSRQVSDPYGVPRRTQLCNASNSTLLCGLLTTSIQLRGRATGHSLRIQSDCVPR